MTVHTWSFPPPDKLLNLNHRDHWQAHARTVKRWRTAAALTVPPARRVPRGLPFSTVSVDLPVRDRRRRDPHNLAPTLKAIIDGLVDAKIFVDDSSEYLTTSEPTFTVGSNIVTVTITVGSQA